jgi:hypothetical protein
LLDESAMPLTAFTRVLSGEIVKVMKVVAPELWQRFIVEAVPAEIALVVEKVEFRRGK